VFIVKVLDRAHQVPLAVQRQCRPRTSGVENLDCDSRRQRQILQRKIEHRVSEKVIDDVDVAVLDGAQQGDVLISFEKNLAGFEHALHIRQSTMGSVITECVKFDRHLQRKRQTLVLCSDGTADSADGDGVDIEARTWGSIHSKLWRSDDGGNCDAAAGSTTLMGATLWPVIARE